MEWCCVVFKNSYEAAGERGLAILAGRNSAGNPEFVLQHRAFDKDVESLPETEAPMSVISEARISYCPWCGRNLEKWYGKHVNELDRPALNIHPT